MPDSTVDSKDSKTTKAESEYACRMIADFRFYLSHINSINAREKLAFSNFSDDDKNLINMEKMAEKHKEITIRAQANQSLLEHSIQYAMRSLGPNNPFLLGYKLYKKVEVPEERMSKVRSLIKQLVRDWSEEGKEERNTCYSRVIKGLEDRFPNRDKRHNVNVLVPGAGLARLAWEFMGRGFSTVANEFDLSMISVANFVLNGKLKEKEISIFPYIAERLNCWTFDDRLREILVPDVDMSTNVALTRKNSFGFAMGDFMTSFEESDVFDAVVSVFFLDTAKNPIDYMRIIHKILKPGGIWLNFGPLLYHYADMPENAMECIELPFDEILTIADGIGFEIQKTEGPGQNPPCFYAKNQKSMLTYSYDCGYFEAVKKI